MKKLLIVFYVLSLVFFISAVTITNFTNNSSSGNITFMGDENQTLYIQIPSNANITEAGISLIGSILDLDKNLGDPYSYTTLSSLYSRAGMEFNFTGIKIDNVSFYMAEETDPSGNISITFRNFSDDSIIYSKNFGSIPGFITENWGWNKFDVNNSPLITEPIYILIERDVQESDGVRWADSVQDNQDTFTGIRSVRYNGASYLSAGYSSLDDPPMIVDFEEGYGYLENVSIFTGDNSLTSTSTCTQESANETNQTGTDGNCNLDYSGSYDGCSAEGYDGSWANSCTLTGDFYVNYTFPNIPYFKTGQLHLKTQGSGSRNLYCYNGTGYHLITALSSTDSFYYNLPANCFNASINIKISQISGEVFLWEEAMIWDINDLSRYENESTTINMDDFSNDLNDALNKGSCDCSGCSLGDNCTIPFIFYSDSAGDLFYNQLSINYSSPSVNQSTPLNDSWQNTLNPTFTCNSSTDNGQTLKNITIEVYNSSGALENSNNSLITGISNSTSLEVNVSGDGNYTWGCLVYDSSDTFDLTDSNYSFRVDTIPPSVNITSPANNSDIVDLAVTFGYSISDETTLSSCSFTVRDSLGVVNNGLDEEFLNCSETSQDFSVTKYSSFTLNVSAIDSAGNIFSNLLSFSTSPTSTGGGGSSVIIVGMTNDTRWSMETEGGGSSYELDLIQGGERTKDILFENLGTSEREITLSCQTNSSKEDLCKYINFDYTSFTLPISKEFKLAVPFTINLPKDFPKGDYDVNIIATDDRTATGVITLKAHVQTFWWIREIGVKLTSSKDINGTKIPYVLITIMTAIFTGVVSFFVFIKPAKISGFFSILLGMFCGFGILLLI